MPTYTFRYGDKDVAWGKAFVYAAMVFSKRMMDRDNTEKIVTVSPSPSMLSLPYA